MKKLLGNLIIGLGLFISLAAFDDQQAASPFDDAPQAEFTGWIVAPTLPALQRSWTPGLGVATPEILPTTVQRPTASEETETDAVAVLAPPDTLVIPAIGLRASIVASPMRSINIEGTLYEKWKVPNSFLVGWLPSSAVPGQAGNTVLGGHHNEYGEVFGKLVNVKPGDVIEIYAGPRLFVYEVDQTLNLPERDQPIDIRLANAKWIQPSRDERLTLVTCWPAWANTNRLIVVARPYNNEMEDTP